MSPCHSACLCVNAHAGLCAHSKMCGMQVYTHLCMLTRARLCVCVCMHSCMRTSAHRSVCPSLHLYVCLYVSVVFFVRLMYIDLSVVLSFGLCVHAFFWFIRQCIYPSTRLCICDPPIRAWFSPSASFCLCAHPWARPCACLSACPQSDPLAISPILSLRRRIVAWQKLQLQNTGRAAI